MVSKRLSFGVGCFFCVATSVFSMEWTVFQDELMTQISRRVLADVPLAVSKNILVTFDFPSHLDGSKIEQADTVDIQFYENAGYVGRTILPVRFLDASGNEIYSVKIRSIVDVSRPFVRTLRMLPKGTVVATEDVRIEFESIVSRPGEGYDAVSQVVGQETVARLQADTLLTPRVIQPIPLIRQGQTVDLIFIGDGVELKIKGIALEDGQKNNTIRVKTATSRHFKGDIIDSQTVRILGSY